MEPFYIDTYFMLINNKLGTPGLLSIIHIFARTTPDLCAQQVSKSLDAGVTCQNRK